MDKAGKRWHFVMRLSDDVSVPYDERPYELYFRDDDRTEFGLIRFEKRKDNPYRNYDALVSKIMNDGVFRHEHANQESKRLWRKNWK